MNYLIKWRDLRNANTDYAKWERVAPDKVREFITRHNGPQNLAITLTLLAAGDEVRFPTFAIRCAPESVTARGNEKPAKTPRAVPTTAGAAVPAAAFGAKVFFASTPDGASKIWHRFYFSAGPLQYKKDMQDEVFLESAPVTNW